MAKVRINITLDEEVLKAVDKEAKKQERTRSNFLNVHLRETLKVKKQPTTRGIK